MRDPLLIVPTGDDIARFERDLCADGTAAIGATIRTFGSLTDEIATRAATPVAAALTPPQRLALIRAATAATPLRLLSRSSRSPGLRVRARPADRRAAGGAGLARRPARGRRSGRGRRRPRARARRPLRRLRGAPRRRRALGRGLAGGRGRRRAARRAGRVGRAAGPGLRLRRPDRGPARARLRLLAEACEVTVAVNYADRRALAARATLLARLRDEFGAADRRRARLRPGLHRAGDRCATSTASCSSPAPAPSPPDEGLRLLECAGERGEAEAVGLEIARLLAAGVDPGDIVIALRRPSVDGPLFASVLRELGVPVALEADLPLAATAVGRSLVALCRAASDGRRAGRPARPPAGRPVGRARRGRLARARGRAERGRERRASSPAAGRTPPVAPRPGSWRPTGPRRGCWRSRRGAAAWPRRRTPRGRAARGRAPERHAARPGRAPRGSRRGGAARGAGARRRAARLPGARPGRRGARRSRSPACAPGAARPRAGCGSSARTGSAPAGPRYLFCAAMQEGVFPGRGAIDPLLGEESRARLGIAALRRREQSEEERYLFHVCASRPVERLYLSWRSSDEDGHPAARSPFVDEVLDLIGERPADGRAAARSERGRSPRPCRRRRRRTTPRSLARAVTVRARPRRRAPARAARARWAWISATTGDVLGLTAAIPDPDAKPGPLRHPRVLEALRERRLLSANSLEGWIQCSYQWFVDHELAPQRLEPERGSALARRRGPRGARPALRGGPGRGLDPAPRRRRRLAGALQRAARRGHRGERVARDAGPEAWRSRGCGSRSRRSSTTEAAGSTALRPRPGPARAWLRVRRGGGRPGRARARRGRAARADRPDRRRAGRQAGARFATTRRRRRCPGVTEIANEGKLQLQLYMLAARERLGLDPIGGLYQPLGAYDDRRPRGILVEAGVRRWRPVRGPRPLGQGRCPRRGRVRGRARRGPRARDRQRRPDARRRHQARPARRRLLRVLHLPADLPARARARARDEETKNGE